MLPDLNFLKIFHCQHIAGVEIQPMSLTASTNIFNTLVHTLLSVNMTHLSRKVFFIILIFHHHVISWKLSWSYYEGFQTSLTETSLRITKNSIQSRRMAYWLEATV